MTISTMLLVGRIGVRRTRRAVRGWRGAGRQRGWQRPLGPLPTAFGSLLLRPPVAVDADRFADVLCEHRSDLANLHLNPTGPPTQWSRSEVLLTWTERMLDERTQARSGQRYPELLLLDGVLIGEVQARIDFGTASAQLALWITAGPGRLAVVKLACARFLLHILDAADPPRRFFVEIPALGGGADRAGDLTDSDGAAASGGAAAQAAVVEPAAARESTGEDVTVGELSLVFAALGFSCEGTLRRSRERNGQRTDHYVWVAHNSLVFRRNLQDIVDAQVAAS